MHWRTRSASSKACCSRVDTVMNVIDTSDRQCSSCKHRQPKYVCGCSESPHFATKIDGGDCCDYFLLNPAELHFEKGLLCVTEGGRDKEAIDEWRMAIQMGLPEDTEMVGRFFLGEVLFNVATQESKSNYECVRSPNCIEGLAQMEKAIAIDRQGAYGYFADPVNRSRLRQLDSIYTSVVFAMPQGQDDSEKINYLEAKLGLFTYLASCPLLRVLRKLAEMYSLAGQKEKARICFRTIDESEPVDRIDEDGKEKALREEAHRALELVSEGLDPFQVGPQEVTVPPVVTRRDSPRKWASGVLIGGGIVVAAFLFVRVFNRPSETSTHFGPTAVFHPPSVVWESMQDKCRDVKPAKAFTACVTSIMEKAGASKEAVAFTQLLGGEGYMDSFRQFGSLGLATSFLPFRANDNGAIYILNGSPPLIRIDEIGTQIDIRNDPLYPSLVRRYPNIALGPDTIFVKARPTKTGQQLIFGMPLLNGCPACETVGNAAIALEFDTSGRLLGTKLLGLAKVKQSAGPVNQ